MTRLAQGVVFTLSFLAFVTFIYHDNTRSQPVERGVSPPSFAAVPIATAPFILLQGEGNEEQFNWKNTQ